MSASPLPAIQVTGPTSTTAQPVTRSRGDTGFDSHLQNAQRAQTASSDDAQDSSNNDDANQQNATQASTDQGDDSTTSTSAESNKAAASGAQGAAAATSDSDSDVASTISSLANTVLSLIDQATGDSGSDDAATGTKSASDKQTTQSAAHPQPCQPSAALPTTNVTPPPIIPVSSVAKTSDNTGSTANTSIGAVSQSGNATIGSGLAGAPSAQKSPGTDISGGNDASSDANSGSSANTATDSSSTLQSAADSTQALATTLSAAGHVASAAAADSVTASSPTQNTPDLAALRGVLDTTAVLTPSGTSASGGHSLTMDSPVGSSGFAKELGQQVSWLSGQEVKQAQIRLNPQDLGPLDVKVSVDHGRVDVAFMTQHPAATAAVQQGLGQLNQMLGNQGLSLGHTTVGQHGAQQQFGGSQAQQSNAQANSDSEETADNSVATTLQRVAVGLVDAFA